MHHKRYNAPPCGMGCVRSFNLLNHGMSSSEIHALIGHLLEEQTILRLKSKQNGLDLYSIDYCGWTIYSG